MDLSEIDSCLVLAGGESDEREVSIQSGQSVCEALNSVAIESDLLILDKDEVDPVQLEDYDVVFIAMHGTFGEDGRLQKILTEKNIYFTGSLEKCCHDSFDKDVTKQILKENNLPTPRWIKSNSINELGDAVSEFDLPVVFKPVRAGSSQGVHIVRNRSEIQDAVFDAFNYCSEVMIEEFIAGRELTVGVLNNRALPIIELKTRREFYDYLAKYEDDDTEYVCPAELEKEAAEKIRELALAAFSAVGAKDFARIDFMLDQLCNPYILEINIIPGFTSHSLLPKAALEAGISFPELCRKIIELAVDG